MRVRFSTIAILLTLTGYGQERPQKRNSAAMVFHEKSGEVLLYGGSTHSRSSTLMRDSAVWSWNGKRWKKITHAPSLRSDVILAYNPENGSIILHGGHFNYSREKESHYSDTWEYDGVQWTLISTSFPSKTLFHSAGTFDKKEKKLVVFGGYDASAETLTADLRQFANGSWSVVKPATVPKPRNLQAVVYNESLESVQVLGGDGMGSPVNDMWQYTNKSWELVSDSIPFTLDNPMGAVSLGESGDIFCFVGSSHQNVAETWRWISNEKRWEKFGGQNPSPRNSASLAFDPHRNCVVLFGGEIGIESVDELWEFSITSMTWKQLQY